MKAEPTREEIQKYMKSNKREHTFYLVSIHFDIDITRVYKIMEGR